MLSRHPRVQAAVSISTLAIVLAVSLTMLFIVDIVGPQVMHVGGWQAPIGIVLVQDRLAALMLVISAIVTLSVLIYSVGQGMADGDEETPVSIFHPTYLILAAGVANAFVSGDLFNLYVGFEILLAASYVLLTLGGTASRVRAGMTYVVVSLLSSLIFLAAIGMIYGATGTVNLAQLSMRIAELPLDTQHLLHIMLLLAFGIKAAIFPLSFWLPDSYPTAPAPVTAVFAGLLTKVGIYAIIRTETVLFPDSDFGMPLMILSLLTMLVGILGAIAQFDLKRLLSFTLVSHIGYMLFGIALGTQIGLNAAIYYVIHHITVQTTLFLGTGLVERLGGSASLRRLGGLAKFSPVLAILFFIPAMNLAGIPPFSGFLGKLGLFQAGVDVGTPLAYLLVAGGALTSLLTLYAIGRVWNFAFWRSPADAEEPEDGLVELMKEHEAAKRPDGAKPSSRTEVVASEAGVGVEAVKRFRAAEAAENIPSSLAVAEGVGSDSPVSNPDTIGQRLPKTMVGSTAAMVVVSILLTVFAGPLYGVSERAAAGLDGAAAYVEAVFGGPT
ncbi:Na+/H+ antiporter subunit D [Saxibacter everestensis]|uniref:Na+/H+ antiporter subunit D n=1 Tax=Saxibacter everestensis TaxID=2909229 RepID=A0ABY8R151_9MICO|nr:Na+/H+ antiporter subunit D [Brevibacteriaceae bacterium ZFBP1038]